MSRSTDLYSEGGNEIDLRSEFEQLMEGTKGETAKKQRFVLRKMRRDTNDDKISCSCKDSLTNEPDTEVCPFCLGEGYYWDETWIDGYTWYVGSRNNHANRRIQLAPGVISGYDKIFYLYFSVDITYDDKIVQMKLDSEGDLSIPYTRKLIFRPETIMEMRGEDGRIEFYTIYVNELNGIRVK